MSWYYGWRPYVPVHVRRRRAQAYAAKLAKKEKRELCPVMVDGRQIAHSFWGRAWCDNLERYSDFENRLPRGRTYVRNGSVIDVQIKTGQVHALVSGSEIYKVKIQIKTLHSRIWERVKSDCANAIGSLIDLLQGRFDEGVMRRLTKPKQGMFPQPEEIKMSCSCPDWAVLCKHVAAVLYGIGARLDHDPELLFTLRGVDHLELIEQAVAADSLDRSLGTEVDHTLAANELGEVFGIEIDNGQRSNGEASHDLPAIARNPRSRARASIRKVTAAANSGGKAKTRSTPKSKKAVTTGRRGRRGTAATPSSR